MKIADLNSAMYFIDDKYLDVFDAPDKEIINMDNKNRIRYGFNKSSKGFKYLLRVVMAACMIFALGVTAYAANLFGIRELFETPGSELSEEAAAYIQHENASANLENLRCSITESLCDASNIMVTLNISGGDKYIIAPADVSAYDPVSIIGLSGNQKLIDYAESKGKKLLLVGAYISKVADEEIHSGSQRAENISESEMAILVKAAKTVTEAKLEAVCLVSVTDAETNEIQKIELPVSLTEAPAISSDIKLSPVNSEAVSGIKAGEASIVETPLGIDVRIPITVTDEDLFENILKTEIEGLAYGDGSGFFLENDGMWYFKASMCQGKLKDGMILKLYDYDKVFIGSIEFK